MSFTSRGLMTGNLRCEIPPDDLGDAAAKKKEPIGLASQFDFS